MHPDPAIPTNPSPARRIALASSSPNASATRVYAQRTWAQGRDDDTAVGSHPHAVAKGITWAAGARRGIASGKIIGNGADCLLIPIRSMDGRVMSLQCINRAGAKQTFGPMGDGCLILGNTLDKGIPWVVVEGWADAVSLVFHHYGGNAVGIAAFGIKRMMRVAQAVADRYQPEEIIILENAA